MQRRRAPQPKILVDNSVAAFARRHGGVYANTVYSDSQRGCSLYSQMARSGEVPRDTIGEWMGHTTDEMKNLYQHLFPQDGQTQISVLK